MKLYYSKNLNPRVAVAVARHLESPVEYIRATPQDPGHEAFRSINPNRLVPVLVEEKQTLWETDAIACRLSALAGSDFWRTDEHMAEMIMWISWCSNHLNVAGGDLYFYKIVMPTFSDETPEPSVLEKAMRSFRRHAAVLDAQLDGKKWLVGNNISYADFRVASALPFAEGAGLPLSEFSNVKRWHDQLWALDAWRTPFAGLN